MVRPQQATSRCSGQYPLFSGSRIQLCTNTACVDWMLYFVAVVMVYLYKRDSSPSASNVHSSYFYSSHGFPSTPASSWDGKKPQCHWICANFSYLWTQSESRNSWPGPGHTLNPHSDLQCMLVSAFLSLWTVRSCSNARALGWPWPQLISVLIYLLSKLTTLSIWDTPYPFFWHIWSTVVLFALLDLKRWDADTGSSPRGNAWAVSLSESTCFMHGGDEWCCSKWVLSI